MIDLRKSDEFQIWQPFDIVKGVNEQERRIAGYASTESLDRQDEVVLQKGLDFSEFVEHGYFNDNHNQATAAVIGIPDTADFKPTKGWFVTGALLKGFHKADEIWSLAKALVGTKRRLGFSIEGKVLERRDNYVVKAKIRNVAITNCFPGDVRVFGDVEKFTRRHYSGPMVEVVLVSGHKLTGTPNHPVLTQRGWVPLCQLDERRDRIASDLRYPVSFSESQSAPRASSLLSSVAYDIENVPPTFEQIFHLLALTGSRNRICPVQKGQFHGDWGDSDVDIVDPNSLLWHRLVTMFSEKFGEHRLSATRLGERALTADRSTVANFITDLGSSNGLVRSFSEFLALLRGHPAEPQALSFAGGHSFYTGTAQYAPNTLASEAETVSNLSGGFPSAVGFKNLTSKRLFDFSGHVYNLQAKDAWYIANGVVVHNCPVNVDCTWGIVAKSFDADRVLRADEEAQKALSVGSNRVAVAGGHVQTQEDLEKDEAEYLYSCPKCEKSFTSSGGLEGHLQKQHAKNKVTRKSRTLTSEEAVHILGIVRPAYSLETRQRIVALAMRG